MKMHRRLQVFVFTVLFLPLLTAIGEGYSPEYVVAATSLNVREKPGTDAGIIGKLSQGTRVRLLEVDVLAPWVRVAHASLPESGYVHGYYLQFDGLKKGELAFATAGASFDRQHTTRLLGKFSPGLPVLLLTYRWNDPEGSPRIYEGSTSGMGQEAALFEYLHDPSAPQIPITWVSLVESVDWDSAYGLAVVGDTSSFRLYKWVEVKDTDLLSALEARAKGILETNRQTPPSPEPEFRAAYKLPELPGEVVVVHFVQSHDFGEVKYDTSEFVVFGVANPIYLYVGSGVSPQFFAVNDRNFMFFIANEPESCGELRKVYDLKMDGAQLVYWDAY